MRNPKYRIFLILTAVLLSFSFISTPITALVPSVASEEASDAENKTPITTSHDDVKAKETPITTNDISFDIIEEMPQEGELGQESTVGNTTRGNDQIISGNVYDGVYAIRNIGNGQYWMDLQQNIIDETAHIQQYNYTTSPNELFERAAMFKLSYVSATGSYIIRLMMNNLLTFKVVGTDIMTKRIPANDSEVNPADTFIITYTPSGYTIRPYGSSVDGDQYICSRRTTASGMSGAPESYLVTGSLSSNERYGRWELRKYTGTTRSGYSTSISPSITNGLAVGDISTVTVATWSTTIGANKPSLEVSSAYTTRAALTDITSLTDFLGEFRLAGLKAGKFELIYRINNGTTNSYPVYEMYLAIPAFDTDTFYIQNGATGMYMDVEGPSTAVGAYIQQWSFSTALQKQWIITPTSGGYYTIKSRYSNLYLGVDSSNTSLVKQYSTLNDYTQWYFTEKNEGRYAIECKMWNVAGVLATPSDTSGSGANLTMSIYTNGEGSRDEWYIWGFQYDLGLTHYYDYGFKVRYTDSYGTAASKIETYTTTISEYLLQIYAINVTYSLHLYESPFDSCKMRMFDLDNANELTEEHINKECNHILKHNTTMDLRERKTDGTCQTPSIIWTGHIMKASERSDSHSNRYSIVINLFLKVDDNNENLSYTNVKNESEFDLFHEVSHQLSAPDHYCYEDFDARNKCSNQYCDECTNGMSSPRMCVMSYRYVLEDHDFDNLYCQECENDIRVHLSNSH